MTEIVFALGLGERIVGVDTTSVYPETTKALAKIGYLRTLGAEGILALRPDLLLIAPEAGPSGVLEQIERAGVTLRRIAAPTSAAGAVDKIREVGAALGVTSQAEILAKRVAETWTTATKAVAAYPSRPKVLFILAHAGGSPMIAGRGTSADAMIKLAGADNGAAAFEGYKTMSAEAVLAADPEVILISTEGLASLGGASALWNNPALAASRAGRSRHLVAMDSLYLLGFGPRLPDAVEELARRLRTVP